MPPLVASSVLQCQQPPSLGPADRGSGLVLASAKLVLALEPVLAPERQELPVPPERRELPVLPELLEPEAERLRSLRVAPTVRASVS